MDLLLIGTFNPCEDCSSGKAKESRVNKKAVEHFKILGETLFFDITSPSTSTFGGKKHWLLVIEDCTDYEWSYFLKENSKLKNVMLSLKLKT